MDYFDDGYMTQDCEVEVELNQSNHVSRRDQNLIQGMLGYVKILYMKLHAKSTYFK